MSRTPSPAPNRLGSLWRYALAGLISLVGWATIIIGFESAGINEGPYVVWVLLGDPALGVLSFILIRFRHRSPGRVTVITVLVSAVSALSAGPALWAVGSLASRHRWRLLALAVLLNIAAGAAQERFYPGAEDLPWWAILLIGLLVVAVVGAIGYAMGSQRDLLESLRDRADTAEREQQARVAQAQAAERTRIAREMHDVLAHRISLVAMHAGALSYRTDLTREEHATAARTIEDNAHHALRDLREVLGVLRDPTLAPEASPELPQPVIGDLARLVEEERVGGMQVSLDTAVDGELPDNRARTAYRVVQEALTNARKHAPGTSVSVTVTGNADDGVTARIRNAARAGGHVRAMPESGLGLIGLDERVTLAGGSLRHGTDRSGGYVVEAWIPWHT
jgi:signal transduction histidine kinase